MKNFYVILPAIIVLLIPAIAFADDGTAWMPMVGDALPWVVSTVLLPLIAWLSKMLSGYMNHKIKTDMLRKALLKLNHVVVGVVSSLAQEMAEEFKKASEDGKLSETEKAKLKQIAMDRIKDLLDLDTWGVLTSEFGGSGTTDEMINNTVEAVVRNLSPGK